MLCRAVAGYITLDIARQAMVSPELFNLADFLAKLGQFVFGFCTLALGIWAAVFKRRDLFRTELSKR